MDSMYSIGWNVLGGVLATLVAGSILTCIRFVQRKNRKRIALREIRDIFIRGKHEVMNAKGLFLQGKTHRVTEEDVRTVEYNRMLKQFGAALAKWSKVLSCSESEEMKRALD